jgi:hypothetical protein
MATTMAVIAPFLLPYLSARRAGIGIERSLGEATLYSATLRDFVSYAPGSLPGRVLPWTGDARHALFPGVVTALLVGVWIVRRGWRGRPRRPELIFYLVLAATGAVLALGPALRVGTSWLPLPFAAVFHTFPGGSFIRAPVRFALLFALAMAVLAGVALTRGLKRRRPGPVSFAVAWAACALAILELYPGPLSLVDPLPRGIPQVYFWLGSVEGDLAILELPMPATEADEREEHVRYQLYSLVHGKRLVNGVGAGVPPITRRLRREMQAFPSPESVARLRNLGVSYVLVHSEAYPAAERERLRRRVHEAPGVNVVDDRGDIWVLDVVPEEHTGAAAAPSRLGRTGSSASPAEDDS